ncbi:MAG: hypothetical protein K2X55_04445 [Burkholderiaceae bacterium]|nr:hypothetical protein [Burkholderiaceae bacterium]
MRTVILLGTSHPLQCGTCGGVAAESFNTVLTAICKNYGVLAIAEEIDSVGLRKHSVTETIGAQVCRYLQIQSAYCDASWEDRVELRKSFPAFEPIDTTLSAQQLAECELEFEDRYMPPARERFWLAKILQLESWPLLFICGSDHFDTFGALLRENGIQVINGPADWVP